MFSEQQWQDYLKKHLKNDEPNWLKCQREQAINDWQMHGFSRLPKEQWQYIQLKGLLSADLTLVTDEQMIARPDKELMECFPEIIKNDSWWFVVLQDGRIIKKNLPDNVDCITFKEALSKYPQEIEALFTQQQTEDSFYYLSTALSQDGWFIMVPEQVTLEKPIQFIHSYAQNSSLLNLRNGIFLAKGARVTLLEHHISAEDAFCCVNQVNHVQLQAESELTWQQWKQTEGLTHCFDRSYVEQKTGSQLRHQRFDFHGATARHELKVKLQQAKAQCHLKGLYFAKNKQQINHYLTVEHLVEDCYSEQHYRGIIDEKAHGVFQGKIYIAEDAQRSQAHQHNANLLLSDQSRVNTLPQLEIYADDVQCSHGSTVGQLDSEALFYLQARGIDLTHAKKMLLHAFARQNFDELSDQDIYKFTSNMLNVYFEKNNI